MSVRKILVPVDFSPPSRAAFDYALAFAKTEGASLVIVHAVYLPSDVRAPGEWRTNLRAAAMRGMQEIQDAAEAADVAVETEITSEHAIESVERLIREKDIDLVAIGSRGHGALRHALLGSVARQVLAIATCPVLTITHLTAIPKPGEAITIKRILVPTDFSPSAEAAFLWATDFAKAHGASLHLLNAQHIDVPMPGPPGAALPPSLVGELRDAAEKRMELEAGKLRDMGLEVTTEVVWESPASATREAVKTTDADLIVMGTRGQTGFAHILLGSVAERTIHVAPCPVVTLREQD